MQLRHVVTSFLLHPADGTVLLGCRSDRVSTYPGHWGAISGSVEGVVPLEQAYREIEEETGLPPSELELLAEGWPVRFPDWALGVVWVVHPCLLRCASPERVRPDWEHVRFEWVEPSRISRLRAVPKLLEAYEAATAAEGRPDSRWAFDLVRHDRRHGAEQLGLWALEGLKGAAEEALAVTDRRADILSAMKAACREALALRPSMAPVRSAALRVFGVCRDVLGGEEAGAAPESIVPEIAALIAAREEESVAPASAAMPFIPDGARVVTLSYSFTVLCALREAAGRISGLTVAESRPALEGRQTARLAASFGVPTDLVTDAAAVRTVQHADLVMFGADALCADGSVVNKAGTFALCCAARHFGTPALCLATESKVLPAGRQPRMEEMEPEELGEPIPGVRTRNVYFESVPGELVGRVLTGAGPMDPERLRSVAESLAELEDALGR